MIKKRIYSVTVICAALVACVWGCPKDVGITPQPPVVTDQAHCAEACANLQKLGCEEGNPINMRVLCLDGDECATGQTCMSGMCWASCTKFCIDTENQGVWLDPICVSKITSCGDIDKCPLPVPKVPKKR